MAASQHDLRALLAKVFDECRGTLKDELEPAEYERRRQDFVFHMTDWLKDLGELSLLYKNGNAHDVDEASKIVIGFLYHVIPHLSAAGRLLLDEIPDAFAQEAAPRKSSLRPQKAS